MRHWIITKQGYMFLTMRRHWLQRETWILSQSLSHWQLIKDTRCIPWSRNDFLNWTSRGRSLQEISPSFGSIEEITCGWQRSPIWNELLSPWLFCKNYLGYGFLGELPESRWPWPYLVHWAYLRRETYSSLGLCRWKIISHDDKLWLKIILNDLEVKMWRTYGYLLI